LRRKNGALPQQKNNRFPAARIKEFVRRSQGGRQESLNQEYRLLHGLSWAISRSVGPTKVEPWPGHLRGHRLPLVDFRASYVIDSGGISKKGP
jgi:hypothetical protein